MKHDIRICILLLVATFAAAASWAAPRLIVPPEGVAFGEIAAGEAAAKSIELRNVSSSPVAVSQVKGCCGADAALSAMRVEPGSAATLSVSLKPMLPGEFSIILLIIIPFLLLAACIILPLPAYIATWYTLPPLA